MFAVVRRAWRNLQRTPGRTLLLLAVLSGIVGLAVTGVAVQAGAEVGLLDAKRALGNEVRLLPNFRAAREAALKGQSLPAVASVPETLVDSLAASRYVTNVDRTVTEFVASPGLTPVSDQSSGEPSGPGGFGGFAPREAAEGFQLVGNAIPDSVLKYGQSQRELASGRLYTTSEVASGAAVAVIDEALAEKNSLSAGSTFTLVSRDGARQHTFTLVGITRDLTPQEEAAASSGGAIGMRFRLFATSNQIFVPYTVAQKLKDDPGNLSSATFYLDAPENVDAFRQEAAGLGVDPDKYILVADDARARAAAAPFEALEGFTRVGVVALAVVGALVVVLLMSIVARERKLEIGVLRALGASRASIAAQFVVETVTICLAALLIGGLIGGAAAQTSAERLLAREVQAVQNSPTGRTAVLPGGISIIQPPADEGSQTPPKIGVVFGWKQVTTILGLGLLLAMAGSLASVYWSMQMEPASILTART